MLSLSAISNYLILRLSYYLSLLLKRPVIMGSPFALTIETSAGCNLRCPECPTGKGLIKRESPIIDQDLFDKILGELTPSTFWIQLYFQGEPLLDPHLGERIKRLADSGKRVIISTNAQLISIDKAEELVKCGLRKIIISLDGYNQETYEAYRKGGEIKNVTDGISFLAKAKKQLNKKFPVIEVQTIVNRTNEHDLKKIKKLAQNGGADKVVFKTMQIHEQDTMQNWLPGQSRFARYRFDGKKWILKKQRRNACFRIFGTMVCNSDGKVGVCCYDKNTDFQVGEIKEQSIIKIWRGKEYQQFRQKLLNKNFAAICQNCNE